MSKENKFKTKRTIQEDMENHLATFLLGETDISNIMRETRHTPGLRDLNRCWGDDVSGYPEGFIRTIREAVGILAIKHLRVYRPQSVSLSLLVKYGRE